MYTVADFKVGMRVISISLRPADYNQSPSWVAEMDTYAGCEGVVQRIISNYEDRPEISVRFERLDRRHVDWYYKPSWLIPLEQIKPKKEPRRAWSTFREYIKSKT